MKLNNNLKKKKKRKKRKNSEDEYEENENSLDKKDVNNSPKCQEEAINLLQVNIIFLFSFNI